MTSQFTFLLSDTRSQVRRQINPTLALIKLSVESEDPCETSIRKENRQQASFASPYESCQSVDDLMLVARFAR